MKVKQAVIPAAGLGSRFLPVTKDIPKELLPLVDRPCLQHIIDEAIKSGVEEFVIVISKGKEAIESYFKENEHLNGWLLKRGQNALYEMMKRIQTSAAYHFVYQEEPLGLGHAVACAQPLINDDYFFVLLPDDIVDADVPVCQQMNEVFELQQKSIVSVMEVSWDDVHRYGIVEAHPLSEQLGDVKSIIEKPSRKDAPSNLAVVGRYLLSREIFSYIEKTKPGAQGEIQLTDALREIINTSGLHSYSFSGDRYDTGTPLGLLKASLVLALKYPEYKDEMKSLIKMLAIT